MRVGFNNTRHYKKDDTSHREEYIFINTDLAYTVPTYIWIIFQMFVNHNSEHNCQKN